MALLISSCNSALNIIQDTDTSRREIEGHIQYAPSDESALATVLQTFIDGSFRHSTM
jgi:hypothetical protein